MKKLKIALICGGPSLERGISLNSARSVLDHLGSASIEIQPFYLDQKKRAYRISKAQLYSNTPSDFDFKLHQTATALSPAKFLQLLKKNHLAFPVMHGSFGEDGAIQSFLEKNQMPFIGSSASACKSCFDKYSSNQIISKLGFYTLPSALLKIYRQDHRMIISRFFQKHRLKRAIVKPASGGSSIGVFSVATPKEALEKAGLIFSKRLDTRVVLEPFAEGLEFTVIILQNRFGLPVAILPTEIETDYAKHQIFDFRKKYLPTRQVAYHCPPRFSNETIEEIQVRAEQLFAAFSLQDFGRFDGWVLKNGQIWFSDFNPVSGMEQNSFLFQQASRVGLSHRAVLKHIVQTACRRYGLAFPEEKKKEKTTPKKPVHVLFGGSTSERQVSLMSGTNVWLKLKKSQKYEPHPFLLDIQGNVWKLPYHLTLNHTAEEILANCQRASQDQERLKFLEKKVKVRLFLKEEAPEEFGLPQKMSLKEFAENSAFVFLGLHGGAGEDGTLQKFLQEHHVKFNGPEEKTSFLCMDKWQTAQTIKNLNLPGLGPIPGKALPLSFFAGFASSDFSRAWQNLLFELKAKTLVIKPRQDGCSSGVLHLFSASDLEKYIHLAEKKVPLIEKNTFPGQKNPIEMPLQPIEELLIEKYIKTDTIRVKGSKLKHHFKTGWIEITVGVLEQAKAKNPTTLPKKHRLTVFNPSITIAENEVLSVEEKFQGGTGVNITPPPLSIVSAPVLQHAKKLIGSLAEKLKIEGYSRIDAFLNIKTGKLLIIEINTLPGLTPSTVFYHQALAEKKPLFPENLLEELIANKGY
ncbi:MAG: hypothetical protein WC371_01980 [Parachlamydiales bacterium]|jgi:D-alanine--D-alanine ligase